MRWDLLEEGSLDLEASVSYEDLEEYMWDAHSRPCFSNYLKTVMGVQRVWGMPQYKNSPGGLVG